MDCYDPKIVRVIISLSFLFKKLIFFMLIKEQNNSNQSSPLIDPIGFLSSSKLMLLVFSLKACGRFDFKVV